MKQLSQILFQVKSDLIFLEEVLSQFEALTHSHIELSIWSQCKLALAEGFTNAVRHAHRQKPRETPIQIEVQITQREILIKIWDYGEPFVLDNFSALQSENEEVLAPGGRGLEIMYKIADELRYDRLSDDRNCLTIQKQVINSVDPR